MNGIWNFVFAIDSHVDENLTGYTGVANGVAQGVMGPLLIGE